MLFTAAGRPVKTTATKATDSDCSAFGVRSFGTGCRTLAKFSSPREPWFFRAFPRDEPTVRHPFTERCANGYASRASRHAIRWSGDYDPDKHFLPPGPAAPRSGEGPGHFAPPPVAADEGRACA